MDLYNELSSFREALKDYRKLLSKLQFSQHQPLPADYQPYRENLLTNSSHLVSKIKTLTSRDESLVIYEMGKPRAVDMWQMGLRNEYDYRTVATLDACIDNTTLAIGKLEADIKTGIRDEQGDLIKNEKRPSINTMPPKAFIAHGGKSGVLNKLLDFIRALGIDPIIVELSPSRTMSVDDKVKKYMQEADCGIVLATKGGIVDKSGKREKQHPRLNVIGEFERLRAIFPDRTILLLEQGVELPSDITGITHEPFARQSMDTAFTAIVRELTDIGILGAVKPQKEQT